MTDIALRPVHRRRHWPRVALVLSLALNAFFIGATATDLLRFHTPSDDGLRALRFELRWLQGQLPRAGFEQVEAAAGAIRPDAEAHIEKLRQLRQGLGDLVAAPTPDRAA